MSDKGSNHGSRKRDRVSAEREVFRIAELCVAVVVYTFFVYSIQINNSIVINERWKPTGARTMMMMTMTTMMMMMMVMMMMMAMMVVHHVAADGDVDDDAPCMLLLMLMLMVMMMMMKMLF
jgi:hypothetical protein